MQQDKFLSMSVAMAVTGESFAIIAAPAYGQSRQVVVTAPRDEALPTRRVTYADLNLASHKDQSRLKRRVGTAVRDVCRESVGLMPPKFLDLECRLITWSGARPQNDRAIARAQEIAASGSSSIAAGSIAISLTSSDCPSGEVRAGRRPGPRSREPAPSGRQRSCALRLGSAI